MNKGNEGLIYGLPISFVQLQLTFSEQAFWHFLFSIRNIKRRGIDLKLDLVDPLFIWTQRLFGKLCFNTPFSGMGSEIPYFLSSHRAAYSGWHKWSMDKYGVVKHCCDKKDANNFKIINRSLLKWEWSFKFIAITYFSQMTHHL